MGAWSSCRRAAVGLLLGAGLFLVGGIGVVPAHATPQATVKLQPWVQKEMCDYPGLGCTSHGGVVTTPAVMHAPITADH